MTKIINKSLPYAGILIVLAVILLVSQAMGAKSDQPKNTQVQTVKITKTYQDFNAAQDQTVSIISFPPGVEILSTNIVIPEQFETNPQSQDLGFSSSISNCAPNSSGNPSAQFAAKDNGVPQNEGLNPQSIFNDLFCGFRNNIEMFVGGFPNLTRGSMDIYISYIVH